MHSYISTELPPIDPACAFRASLLPLYVYRFSSSDAVHTNHSHSLTSYSRLVMYSFGFQQAYRRGIQTEDQIFIDNVRTPLRSSMMIRRCSFSPVSTVLPGRKVGHIMHDRYVMPQRVHAVLARRYVTHFQKGRITDAGRLRSANQPVQAISSSRHLLPHSFSR